MWNDQQTVRSVKLFRCGSDVVAVGPESAARGTDECCTQ